MATSTMLGPLVLDELCVNTLRLLSVWRPWQNVGGQLVLDQKPEMKGPS